MCAARMMARWRGYPPASRNIACRHKANRARTTGSVVHEHSVADANENGPFVMRVRIKSLGEGAGALPRLEQRSLL